jgi:hypothetical protein
VLHDRVASQRTAGFRRERAREGCKCDGSGTAANTADPRIIIGDAGEHKGQTDCDIIQRMLKLFRNSGRHLQEDVRRLADELHVSGAGLTNRIQPVETECARIRLQRMLRGIHEAAEVAIRMGVPAKLAIGKGL